jgi:DNA polymerase III subunit alpha
VTTNFVHLHTHTEYSTLDGINRVKQLPTFAKQQGMSAVAITDHGNMAGSYSFFKSCREAEIKPILGIEAYYTVNDRQAKEADEDGQKYYHIILLAKNDVGLKNLFELSTRAYTEGMYHKPRVDDQLLSDLSEGVIATSACLGSRSSQLLIKGRRSEAERLITHHANMFKDNFYIELQPHRSEEQQLVNQVLLQIAKEHNLPIIITGDSHYSAVADKKIHELALCMQTNKTIFDEKRFTFGEIQVPLSNYDWMWAEAQLQNIPHEALSNTGHIADLIDDSSYFSGIKNDYPKFMKLPKDITSWQALERLCKYRLSEKMGGMPPVQYRKRINHELKIIKQMGFSDYLLIVQDFIQQANKMDVWTGPGRGSAAGSLVAYALGITKVDPIKYGLLFERFLNPGRAARPIIF